MGARRKRACMQAVIPKFIIDRAVDMCNQTLENEMKKVPIDERKEKMKDAFAEIADWITPELLAGVCGKDFDNLSIKDIVRLGNLYNAIKDGFVLIYNKLIQLLKRFDVEEIKAVGEVFDTDFHEAVTHFPTDKEEDKGKVIDVTEKGYKLKDKVIRYAKVVVGQ